jgi:hypothetical protein
VSEQQIADTGSTIFSAEQWRPVTDFPWYEVSNQGRVRSLSRILTQRNGRPRRVQGRVLVCSPDKKGYRVLTVRGLGGRKERKRFVHQLVLGAFVGRCPDGHEANHKDGRHANNCLTNLEYLTGRQNKQHAWDTGLTPRQRKRKTYCTRGHRLVVPVAQTMPSSGNRYVYYRCRECKRARDNNVRRQKMALAA